MENKQFSEAEEIYREELAPTTNPKMRHPNSIWALAGLLPAEVVDDDDDEGD